MKKIFLVVSEIKDGKRYAHSETVKCETATQAAYLAVDWNQAYKANGELIEW